jgi:HlyD family secretion protein
MKRIMFLLPVLAVLFTAGCNGNRIHRWTGVVEGEIFTVAAPVTDRLSDLVVTEGDFVRQGDLLGNLDTTTQKLQMESLEAKIRQISLMEEDLENQLKVAGEAEALALSTLERYNTLREQEGVSEQVLDELGYKAEQASSAVRSLEIKRKTLASQKNDLDIQYRSLQEIVDRSVLKAPGNGLVDKIYYSPGEYVPALRPVMEIVDLGNLWCMIYVPEEMLPRIDTETVLSVRAGGETLTGRVVHINAAAEFTPRELLTPDNRQAMAYGVKIRLDNSRGVLKIGMPVDLFLDDSESR